MSGRWFFSCFVVVCHPRFRDGASAIILVITALTRHSVKEERKMSSQVPMTQEGYEKIQAEINELEARRPSIKKQIEEAREKGDLRENADYHAAREELGMLNAKISHLNTKLANSVIVNPNETPEGKVSLFKTITFKRVKDGVKMSRTLVGEGEADPATGKILATSPIGQALIGKEVGDTVVANLPGGPMELKILKIE